MYPSRQEGKKNKSITGFFQEKFNTWCIILDANSLSVLGFFSDF